MTDQDFKYTNIVRDQLIHKLTMNTSPGEFQRELDKAPLVFLSAFGPTLNGRPIESQRGPDGGCSKTIDILLTAYRQFREEALQILKSRRFDPEEFNSILIQTQENSLDKVLSEGMPALYTKYSIWKLDQG